MMEKESMFYGEGLFPEGMILGEVGPAKVNSDGSLSFDYFLIIDPLFGRITHGISRTLESFGWEDDEETAN